MLKLTCGRTVLIRHEFRKPGVKIDGLLQLLRLPDGELQRRDEKVCGLLVPILVATYRPKMNMQ